jgi:8-oxo-dGTP diphosphatase
VRPVARPDGALGVALTRLDVVGAVLVQDAHVLAARRSRAPRCWEFPGGKVEAGETPQLALERECREELGVDVRALARIATARDDRVELALWHAVLVSGTPAALHDHDALRWLSAAELDEPDWLPIDRSMLDAVRALLSPSRRPRC